MLNKILSYIASKDSPNIYFKYFIITIITNII